MSKPNEPGYPGPGDSPPSPAARAGAGRITDTGEPPPWQRGAAPQPRPAQQPAQPRPPSPSPGVDARLNRFAAGTKADPAPGETQQADGYASELPDLSGSTPRVAQRKSSAEAGDGAGSAGSTGSAWVAERRVQVSPRTRGPLRASMQIRRIDPWSALKVSLLLSVALFFVWMIAVALLYLVLGSMGVWSKLNSNVGDLLTNTGGAATGELVSSGSIFGGAVLIGLVNIVLLTAMATLGAVVYNLSTDLIGGVEVTLADRD